MKRLLLALVLASTLALAGCVAIGSVSLDESARLTRSSLDGLAGDARIDAILDIAATGESQAVRWSGVEQQIGGRTQAESTLIALRAPLEKLADEPGPSIAFAPASFASEAGGGSSFLGLGFVMIGWMGNNAMDLADAGELGSQSGNGFGADAEITISPDGSVSSSFEMSGSEGGTSAKVTANTELPYCPDPDGELELTGKTDVNISIKSTTLTMSLEIVATGQVDDTATLVSSDHTYRYQIASSVDGKGEFFDHSSGSQGGLTVNRESSGTTVEFAQSAVDSAAALADMVAKDMLDAAQRGWESGRCVTLTVNPSEDPGSLEPGARMTLEAAPTSAHDGQPTEGTVSATLSGEGDLDPAGSKIDAPATFDYTAGDEKNERGTVTFESRSNRGVGRATVTLETGGQAYSASGTEGEFTATGTICSLSSQFVLSGNGLTLTFTPASDLDGTFRLTGVEDGVSFIGDGTYDVNYGNNHLATSVVVDGDMTLSTPEGVTATSPTDLNVVLTPIEPCD